jgi:hypothetical protein
MFASLMKALKRLGMALGLWIEKATETDALNEAVVEKSIREQKEKAGKANYANGQLQSQIILLKEQLKGEERKKIELAALVDMAVKQNDEANGAIYAEQLADLESDIAMNNEQLTKLTDAYKMNTEIIAESLRQIRKLEQDFVQLRARVKVSRNMEALAEMMKASITELQGMTGSEASEAIQRMRVAAAQGQGQVTATMDLAKEMGANIKVQQEARKARGKALFAEYKAKAQSSVQTPEATTTAAPASAERQKIAVAQ